MPDFNPPRLKLARERRGLTKIDLERLSGVSTRSLTAIEQGVQVPTLLTVARLASVLGFPVSFFSGSAIDEVPEYGASFRAFSRITARQRHQALASGQFAIELAEWMHARFTLPEQNVPRLRGVDPETGAAAVRRTWGLGERPIRNMIHLLEANGVRVFSLTEECQEVDAFSFWLRDTPYVFLNTMKSSERSRMDAAHELGHLVMHWRHDGVKGRKAEEEAQHFGSAFLMPAGSVVASGLAGARLDQLIRAKKQWNVAASALAYRMRKLGLLSEWQYRSIFVELSTKGFTKHEPKGIARETSQVLAKVFKALRAEGLSKAEVARELSLPLEELNKIVFGLVPTVIEGERDDSDASLPPKKPELRLISG